MDGRTKGGQEGGKEDGVPAEVVNTEFPVTPRAAVLATAWLTDHCSLSSHAEMAERLTLSHLCGQYKSYVDSTLVPP